MNKKFPEIFVGIVAAVIFLILATRSGALPFALAGGGLASGVAFFVSREWPITLAVGGGIALAVSAIGVGLMLSSG